MPTTARFTSEALENMRHRYVETDEPLMRIGSDFGISDKTVLRIAKRENWPMRASRLRDLPLHVKLSIEAENAARAEIQSSSESETLELAARLERAVERELAVAERTLSDDPDRRARTLASLTATLAKIRTLRVSEAPKRTPEDDDVPEDTNEFRIELARRIDAFVASRTGEDGSAQKDTNRIPEKPPGDGWDR